MDKYIYEWLESGKLAVSDSVEDLKINISAVVSHKLIPGETIFFIDEVQELKEIVTRIKFWVDEGSFRYILSGSLLGVELKALRSVPVGEVVHNKMMKLFKRYLVVGGMPQAVNEYIESGNISRVGEIQRDIINFYKRDFTKYESEDNALMLKTIYDLIPAQLLK